MVRENMVFDLLCGPLVWTHFWSVFLVHKSNGTFAPNMFVGHRAAHVCTRLLWKLIRCTCIDRKLKSIDHYEKNIFLAVPDMVATLRSCVRSGMHVQCVWAKIPAISSWSWGLLPRMWVFSDCPKTSKTALPSEKPRENVPKSKCFLGVLRIVGCSRVKTKPSGHNRVVPPPRDIPRNTSFFAPRTQSLKNLRVEFLKETELPSFKDFLVTKARSKLSFLSQIFCGSVRANTKFFFS